MIEPVKMQAWVRGSQFPKIGTPTKANMAAKMHFYFQVNNEENSLVANFVFLYNVSYSGKRTVRYEQ